MRIRTFTAGAVTVGLLGLGVMVPSANATAIGNEGKIAFVRSNQIYTMTKTGGSVTKLTTTGKNYRAKWSPDGKRIAYINEVATKKDVWIMSATGTNKVRVTTTGNVTAEPVWSPNGNTLAYGMVDDVDGIPLSHVYLINSNAPFVPNALRIVTPDGWPEGGQMTWVEPGGSMAWAPNGSDLIVLNQDSETSPDWGVHQITGMTGAVAAGQEQIAHVENVIMGSGGACCGYDTFSDFNYIPNGVLGWTTNDHGEWGDDITGVYKLTYPGFVSQAGDQQGAPSPNGKDMVFVRVLGTTSNIWTATISGGSRKMIQANAYTPDWQPA